MPQLSPLEGVRNSDEVLGIESKIESKEIESKGTGVISGKGRTWWGRMAAARYLPGAVSRVGRALADPDHRYFGLGPASKRPLLAGPLRSRCASFKAGRRPVKRPRFVPADGGGTAYSKASRGR
jgi:hypothetical protein